MTFLGESNVIMDICVNYSTSFENGKRTKCEGASQNLRRRRMDI